MCSCPLPILPYRASNLSKFTATSQFLSLWAHPHRLSCPINECEHKTHCSGSSETSRKPFWGSPSGTNLSLSAPLFLSNGRLVFLQKPLPRLHYWFSLLCLRVGMCTKRSTHGGHERARDCPGARIICGCEESN